MNTLSYVYQYKDHLGNNRLEYTLDPATDVLTIKEENHYYPFGLKHQNYNTVYLEFQEEESQLMLMGKPPGPIGPQPYKAPYNYKYNGKEYQEELGLNMYDYGARNYDAAIGRWMNIDPLAEQYLTVSPYIYTLNNPVFFIDPDGMRIVDNDGAVSRQKREIQEFITKLENLIKNQGFDEIIGNKFIEFSKSVLDEIKDLEESDQVYNVFVDKNDLSDSGSTYYDFNTSQVMVSLGTTASLGTTGHELKHAHQFEEGKISWNRKGGSTLYDIGDETEGYNRQLYLFEGVAQYGPGKKPDYTDADIVKIGVTHKLYQGLNKSSMDLSSKDGKELRKATIEAGKQGTPVQEVYIGWEKDYQKGIKKRR